MQLLDNIDVAQVSAGSGVVRFSLCIMAETIVGLGFCIAGLDDSSGQGRNILGMLLGTGLLADVQIRIYDRFTSTTVDEV